MSDRGAPATRIGKQIKPHFLVVSDRCEGGVLKRSRGRIARDDKLEHKQGRDRCEDDGMFAECLPKRTAARR